MAPNHLMEVTYLCYLWVAREESPVDISSVTNVRVVIICCGGLQDLGNQALCLIWLLQEQLDNSCEYLKLCLGSVSIAPYTYQLNILA